MMELHQLMEMGEVVTSLAPVADTERDLTRLELLDEIERVEDEYQDVAKALGCRTFFHNDVLERAKELAKYWGGRDGREVRLHV